MAKVTWRNLHGLSSFLLFVGLLAAVAAFMWFIIDQIARLGSDVAAAFIAAGTALVVAVLTNTLGRFAQQEREHEAAAREHKVPSYQKFSDLVFDLFYANKLGNTPPTEKQVMEEFVRFTKMATFWGSDEVIKQWRYTRRKLARFAELQAQGSLPDLELYRVLFDFEKVLIAMRKDTGHPKTKVERGDILGMFIDDIDGMLAAVEAADRGE